MKKMFTLSVVLIPFLCASLAFSQQHQKSANSEDRYGAQRFPARGGSVDWGLALSGGGPRSTFFSIGVMKALYDKKDIWDHIDVISSTSGGSYASYWLYTRYDSSNDQEFGASVFDNNVFLTNVCFLQNEERSNFIANWRALKRLRKTEEEKFDFYEERIINSFGNDTDPKMNFLKDSINARKIPYFIINTSVELSRKNTGSEKSKQTSQVFEITPEYRGNYELTFRDWREEDEQVGSGAGEDTILPFSKAVAYAGIPSMITKRPITFGGQEFVTWDGGETENLAALALIRRGVKNIIIVDAVQDSRSFEAYLTLQRMLQELDIGFCVPDIEKFFKKPHSLCSQGLEPSKGKREKKFSAVYEGKAKSLDDGGTRIDSNIYYIKMADPKAVLPEWFSDDEISDKGQGLVDEREDQRCPENRTCCLCEAIELGFQEAEDRKAFYTNRVGKYSKFLNNIRPWNHPILWLKILPFKIVGKVDPFYNYNFPNITTIELSYSADQVEAFVGLGYLQTMELKTNR